MNQFGRMEIHSAWVSQLVILRQMVSSYGRVSHQIRFLRIQVRQAA